MRFTGLLGIIVILAVAFFISSNKKAIRPRILFWGLGLQLLFATIILSESILSLLGMFVFSFLILLYIFEQFFVKQKTLLTKIGLGTLIFVGSGLYIYLASWLDKWHIAMPLLWISIAVGFGFKLFKIKSMGGYVFADVMLLGLGVIVNRGILGRDIFRVLADKIDQFLKITDLGSVFLFGNLAKPEFFDHVGFQFAFSVLPTIIFFSAFMSILYYFGVMQAIVKMMARFMRWTMGTSGAETLSCSANVFVGQTEAPLLIKPFLDDMTESELHAIMVGGFATIAGGVLAGYIRMGIDPGHLIAASVMSAPAALALAKLMMPETEQSKTAGDVEMPQIQKAENILDATAQGVTDGLKLAVNVGAMLLAFIALVGLMDMILGYFDNLIDGQLLGGVLQSTGEYKGFFPGSLKTFFGTIFSPLAFVMGVPWKDALEVGNLMGIKVAVNEFVGYAELAKHVTAADISQKSITIATYALCGFANFSSIGIQLGGIGAIAPQRRAALSRVAIRAMIGGALASWMTATIAGLLI